MRSPDEVFYHPVTGFGREPSAAGTLLREDVPRRGPRAEWWWHSGPVETCCCCFSLRTGIYLLALWTMISGVAYLRVEKWHVPIVMRTLTIRQTKFKEYCMGAVVAPKQQCDDAEATIAMGVQRLDFMNGMIPVYHVIGAVFVFFALLGWRAGYTGKSLFARVFLMSFPTTFVINLALDALSPMESAVLNLPVNFLMLAYFFKVTWSFYARARMAEEAGRSTAEGVVVGPDGVRLNADVV